MAADVFVTVAVAELAWVASSVVENASLLAALDPKMSGAASFDEMSEVAVRWAAFVDPDT